MDRTDKTRGTLLIGVLLTAVTLAAYWPVLQNDFVSYDDPDYVTENPHVLRGLSWSNVGWAFRTAHAGNWHPLTWLSHALDVQLHGLNTAWHHLTALLFHTANALLLLLWLQRTTGRLWCSAAVAALFALHPLHVESVAWVAERKDVLSTFFFLLTLLAYGRYARKSEGRNPKGRGGRDQGLRTTDRRSRITFRASRSTLYALSLLFFSFGLMSKPMLVTVPFLLLLLDYWPLRRLHRSNVWRRVAEKAPFLALSVASSAVTFLIQRDAGAVSSLEAIPVGFRISNAIISYVRYAAKMVWPANLAVFYPAPDHWPAWLVAGAALILSGVSALALWRARRAPYVPMGWFWYLGTLVPVIGLVQVGQQAMADRYSYIPIIGLFILVVWAAAEIPARWPATRWAVAGCWTAAIGACALLTWGQSIHWRNSASLFAHAIAVTHDNAVAQNNLGVCRLNEGNPADAETHFAEAVRIRPKYPEALVNLGLCRAKQGREAEAFELVQRAVQIQGTPVSHYNLANLLSMRGDLDEAESHYRSALKLKPEFADAWYNLGVLKAKQGKPDDAAQCYAAALQIKPGHTETHLTFGAMLAGQQKFEQATLHFQAVLQTDPGNADARFNLAAASNAKGDFAGAAEHYAEVCRLRPDDLEARQNLGLALLYQGKMSEAAAQFQEVLRVRPEARTHHCLALALDAQGQAGAALPHYREAVRLSPNTALYLNDLAWILATTPKADLRNGTEAVRLAETACRLSGNKEARFIGTLDAAYAEAGRFEDAAATAAKARDLALAAGQQDIAREAEARLALYRAGKRYRPSGASSGGEAN